MTTVQELESEISRSISHTLSLPVRRLLPKILKELYEKLHYNSMTCIIKSMKLVFQLQNTTN